MALALVLKNCTRLQALPKVAQRLPQTSRITNSRSFTQFVNQINKNALMKNQTFGVVAKRNMSTDHGKLWTLEKVVSLGLLGLLPATFLAPNAVCDNLFALTMVVHFHWGIEACVIDYVRPIIFGNVIPKVSIGLVYLISATTLAGLLYYNMNSIGIGKTGQKLFAIKK